VGRYLDRAKQFIEILAAQSASDAPPTNLTEGSTGLIRTQAAAVAITLEDCTAQRELREERLAIMEYDAGLSVVEAQALMLPLSMADPLPSGEGEGSVIVGELCIGCLGDAKISHLYWIRNGVHECRRCRRKGAAHGG
jgi:hypothetical protein